MEMIKSGFIEGAKSISPQIFIGLSLPYQRAKEKGVAGKILFIDRFLPGCCTRSIWSTF